jgi:glycosyltransferase involved in cell wall biosynthesis
MRILFATPYPPSRIRVRGYGFLRQLQRTQDVTVVTQCASDQELADVETLRQQGYEVVVVRESQKRSALRSALSLPGTLPLQVAYARSARFAEAVQDHFEKRGYDVLHVEHLRGMASLASLAGTYPLVWDAVDCISLLCKHTLASGPSLSVRAVALIEQKRTQRFEGDLLKRLQHVVVTSERDRQAMIELCRIRSHDLTSTDEAPGASIRVLPNGVDMRYFCPSPQQKPRRFNVVFSGKMSYHANIAAALYLRQQIMPLIWQRRPEATLTIVGNKPPKAIVALARDPRVEVTGYVSDIRPFIQRADVMLSPMVYSVGIQNKVLEAMALGTPVVAAKQAAASLGVVAGRDLLIAESSQAFAESTLRLMEDAGLHQWLSQHGRAYVEQQHDWGVVTDRLLDLYRHAGQREPALAL